MKHSKIESYVVSLILFAALVSLSLNSNRISKLKESNNYINNQVADCREYINSLIQSPLNSEDLNALEYFENICDEELVVLFPNGTCLACAINLLYMINYYGFSNNKVAFYLAERDIPLINELKIHGYSNYYVYETPSMESLTSIMLIHNTGQPRVLKYYYENHFIINTYLETISSFAY